MQSSTSRCFVAALVLSFVPLVAKAAPEASPPTAFVGVTVVPADRERVIADQTVVVQGGRITALGPVAKVKVPAGALRVDGKGKFLMPGLCDMHGRLPEGSASAL